MTLSSQTGPRPLSASGLTRPDPSDRDAMAKFRKVLAATRELLARHNREFPATLQAIEVPPDMGTMGVTPPVRAWRSRDLLAMLFREKRPGVALVHLRLSIARARLGDDGRWEDGLTWDELQRAKGECGFADYWAVEVYPKDGALVNVANMRHLWLLKDAPPMAWTE